jgi:hypothetical protein
MPATDADTNPIAKIPLRPEDLSANIVTFVSPDGRAAVRLGATGIAAYGLRVSRILSQDLVAPRRSRRLPYPGVIDPENPLAA